MRIRKITLNNIRSYEKEVLEFPKGSTLLSGDIGSGKTSILLAIEFALFGLQPGQRGSSLLKNGKDKGGVIIEFEVDGREIVVERTMKRGSKTIAQDYSAITIDGEKSEISVTEIKDKVLSLLNYPKEFAKKQNILYKFTVYTPQEEMKQIILQDSETRINTLRHVFGIDKYKRILENISILTLKLREEKRMKEGATLSLERDKFSLIEKEQELEDKHHNLVFIEKELFSKTEERQRIQEEIQVISKKVEEKRHMEREIEKTRLLSITKNDSIIGNTRLMKSLDSQINELAALKFDESLIETLEQEIITKKKQKRELNEKNLEITSKISSFALKNQESETTKAKLAHLDICPTCLQNVDLSYRANMANKFDNDISDNTKKINLLSLEKKQISLDTAQLDSEILDKEKRIKELIITRVRLEEIKDKQKRLQ
ncbi:MAG: SMC family ATPase, partial [Nanoarchaeota archaeon]|nr:SMC family ATPase [Nanoarchaeota archaeon]